MAERFRRRELAVDALQIVIGTTTRREILEFCPDANVGVALTDDEAFDMGSTDIYWISLPFTQSRYSGNIRNIVDGDWILKDADGLYFVAGPAELELDFEKMPF